jgi:GNAT superfamily N-acetyltransferase
VPDRCLEWLTPQESAANWAKNFTTDQTLEDGDYLFVAEVVTDGVVGLAMLTRITAEDGYDPLISGQYSYELRSIQVAPAWQRRGVGRQLVSHAAEVLRGKETTRFLVRVLVENPNQVFYENLGAVRLGSRPYDWEGYQTEEILYGFDIRNME